MPRGHLIALVAFAALANGMFGRLRDALTAEGLASATLSTFGVSAIVWWGLLKAGMLLASNPDLDTADGRDLSVVGIASLLTLIPIDALSWVALTLLLGFGVLKPGRRDDSRESGYLIAAACTFSLFWSPKIFSILSQWILTFDAVLVGLITGTGHAGNTVPLADGSGELWIAPKCSSFASLSLVPVCWLAMSSGRRVATSRATSTVILASAGVVLLNGTRIGLIGLYPERYELIHGEIGSTIAGWLTLIIIAGICYRGVQLGEAKDPSVRGVSPGHISGFQGDVRVPG